MIADSENSRVIEVTNTGEVVWNSENFTNIILDWPRSISVLPNDNIIICDPNLFKVIEVNRTGDILWEMKFDVTWPFTAEKIDRKPPIPVLNPARELLHFNESVKILIESNEADLDSIWYNIFDLSSSTYLFPANVSYNGETSMGGCFRLYCLLVMYIRR